MIANNTKGLSSKPPKLLESELLAQVVRYLFLKKKLFWRQNLGGVMHTLHGKTFRRPNPMTGFPDIAGVSSSGHLWCIELKSEKGVLSKQQKEWIKLLSENEVKVLVGRDFATVRKFIDGL